MEEDLFSKVQRIIVKSTGVDSDKVTLDASFIDDLGCDSLDIVELTMEIETEFDIVVEVDRVIEIEKVSDLISLVEDKTRKG